MPAWVLHMGKRRKRKFNRNRKLARLDPATQSNLESLATKKTYRGYGKHKLNSYDFGVEPNANRWIAYEGEAVSLCDHTAVRKQSIAQRLLKRAFLCGTVSRQSAKSGGWPAIAWAVVGEECVVEARCDSGGKGEYHGYPLQSGDPMKDKVLRRWWERGKGIHDD